VQPSNVEILRAVVANLEEVIIPELKTSHAKSAGACARMLLNLVGNRLEREGPLLCEDSAEKRAVLAELATTIDRTPAAASRASLAALAADVREHLAAMPHTDTYIGIEELTGENDSLQGLIERAVTALYEQRDHLGADTYSALSQPIRTQLRSQIDRELSLSDPALDGPPF
jgi:hypothetical protein